MTERCSHCGISPDSASAILCMDWDCPDNRDHAPAEAQASSVAGPILFGLMTVAPIGVVICWVISAIGQH